MSNASDFPKAAFVAPHYLAAQTGRDVLAAGGNAIEAMLAAAAAISVVYPHMNSLGGDAFWLIAPKGQIPVTIMGVGHAGENVTPELYGTSKTIPNRGILAANTVAGALSSYLEAKRIAQAHGGTLSWADLLGPAIDWARNGFPTSKSQPNYTARVAAQLKEGVGNWAKRFLPDGAPHPAGTIQKDPALADFLTQLAAEGPDSFYRGPLAGRVLEDFAELGVPLTAKDLRDQYAPVRPALSLSTRDGTFFNTASPTQGVTSLMVLGLYDKLRDQARSETQAQHLLIEICKLALEERDRHLGDPEQMTVLEQELLDPARLEALASHVSLDRPNPWPHPRGAGDTIYMAALDKDGLAVSFIQSIYWEYGSGVVLPRTGLIWQNRGSAFQLSGEGPRRLAPRRLPMHTLNPAYGELADGRRVVYGTMGGDGQPQTQAQIIHNFVHRGFTAAESIQAPRWVVGKTWGRTPSDTEIFLETLGAPTDMAALRALGHGICASETYSELLGHAAIISLSAKGDIDVAADPRSDGCAYLV